MQQSKSGPNNYDRPKLAEAIRRLVELGLTVKSRGRQSSEGQKLRACEIAGSAIDSMTDDTAQAIRNPRLLNGPEEFHDVRVDRKRK